MMQKFKVALCAIAFSGLALANATYTPSGPQINVDISTVTNGGWTLCFSEAYGNTGTQIGTALSQCGTGDLMMAGGATGSSTLGVLAWAPYADVLFDTGTSDTAHIANGSEWYFNGEFSWGFAPLNATLNRSSCDIGDNDATSPYRLCWHTGAGQVQGGGGCVACVVANGFDPGDVLDGGFRVGTNEFLNQSTDFTRYIFTDSVASTPEPTTLLIAASGLGLLGVVRRRRAR